MRWIAVKTQELKEDNWSVRYIGLVVDVLEDELMQIQEEPKLFLDQEFMMEIVSEISNQITKLEGFLLFYFQREAN